MKSRFEVSKCSSYLNIFFKFFKMILVLSEVYIRKGYSYGIYRNLFMDLLYLKYLIYFIMYLRYMKSLYF